MWHISLAKICSVLLTRPSCARKIARAAASRVALGVSVGGTPYPTKRSVGFAMRNCLISATHHFRLQHQKSPPYLSERLPCCGRSFRACWFPRSASLPNSFLWVLSKLHEEILDYEDKGTRKQATQNSTHRPITGSSVISVVSIHVHKN